MEKGTEEAVKKHSGQHRNKSKPEKIGTIASDQDGDKGGLETKAVEWAWCRKWRG